MWSASLYDAISQGSTHLALCAMHHAPCWQLASFAPRGLLSLRGHEKLVVVSRYHSADRFVRRVVRMCFGILHKLAVRMGSSKCICCTKYVGDFLSKYMLSSGNPTRVYIYKIVGTVRAFCARQLAWSNVFLVTCWGCQNFNRWESTFYLYCFLWGFFSTVLFLEDFFEWA